MPSQIISETGEQDMKEYKRLIQFFVAVPVIIGWLITSQGCTPADVINAAPSATVYQKGANYVGMMQVGEYIIKAVIEDDGDYLNGYWEFVNSWRVPRGYTISSWWNMDSNTRATIVAMIARAAQDALREYGSILSAPILVIPAWMIGYPFWYSQRVPA
jgi:hypothetical protein